MSDVKTQNVPFKYSIIFHGIVGFDIIISLLFGLILIGMFFGSDPQSNGNFLYLVWGIVMLINLGLDAVFLINERKDPKVINYKRCWIKCLLSLVGIFTVLSFAYFFIISIRLRSTYKKTIFSNGPNSALAWNNKGFALLQLGRSQEALVSLERALSIDPNSAAALHYKGATLIKLGRNQEALVSLERALSIDPNSTPVWNKKGAALIGLGRYQEAQNAFDRALSIDPNNKQSQIGRISLNKLIVKTAPVSKNSNSSDLLDEKPTELLCTIIKDNNPDIINNKDAFRGLLKDYFVGDYSKYKKESFILEKSVIESVPQDLLAKKDQIPFPVLSAQLIQRLDDCGCQKELSVWAVHAWARALGVNTK